VSAAPKAAAPPKAAPAPASSFGAMGDALSANLAERQSAIDAQLAELAAFVGDGAPWKVQLAASAASMDASVTSEASYMENLLFGTIVEFLEFINANVRRYATGELLAQASSARTIVFEFVDTDDCPRQYLGAFQAVVKGAKLHFVGPACDFKSNGGGAPNIGRDVENAVMAAAGDTGPTEREKKVAESLAAIAASSSKKSGGGGGGKECRMCKGSGKRNCNHCHGKGGKCTPCGGSGFGRFNCITCGGAGSK
jgi:hypothetical protein